MLSANGSIARSIVRRIKFHHRRNASSKKIVVLPGDGVGPEITREALKVLNVVEEHSKREGGVAFVFEEHLIGGAACDEAGSPFPDATKHACLESDAILLGAVGGPKWDDMPPDTRPEKGLLQLRKDLDLFANLRPVRFFDALLEHSPLRPDLSRDVDMLFVRELTGGIYFGPRSERARDAASNDFVASDTMVYTDREVERIVRVAAKAALERGGDLLSVDKANVLASSRLWREVATRVVAEEFPKVRLRHGLVDSCAMDIIRHPRSFDVIVTKNMFGDILTDEASVLAGSLGLLPSASLSSDGKPGVYEPIHGSAPDIAGQGIANPIGSILSGAMLLRHSLGLENEASAIERAVDATLNDGRRTQDLLLGSEGTKPCTTTEMGSSIASHTKRILREGVGGMRQHARAFSTQAARQPRTMFDKIWGDHVVDRQDDGTCLLYVDRHLVHEVTSPQAFEGLERAGLPVRCPQRTLVTADHNVPTTKWERKGGVSAIEDDDSRIQVETLEKNVDKFGLRYFGLGDERQGIVHIVGPEQGFTLPGMTLVCGDSHTATHGAFGALAFGIGTTEVEHVLATQTLLQKPAKNMLVRVDGSSLPLGVVSKDLALHLCGVIGTAGGTGHVIEYAGEPIRKLSMEARMSICNMAIEAGARAGMIAPDEVTFRYLRGRPMAPKGDEWDRAVAYWSSLPSDQGARFDSEVVIDVSEIVPQVTWGTSPEDVVGIDDRVPSIDDATNETEREQIGRKLEYMGLKGGERMEDITIDKVFIGSCTNARIEDLRQVAEVVEGLRVADGVDAMIVPGSGLVKRQAEDEGLSSIFEAAGFDWREPGCSMCLGMNADKLRPGERCASTSNRNFEGRQGPGGRTHLVSPAMAAAAAIRGRLADSRELGMRRFSTTAAASATATGDIEKWTAVRATPAPLPIDNIDTDMIIPARYLKTVSRSGLSDGLFANMRFDDSGAERADFVLNRPDHRNASILIVGDNFGCGSSREHAPWALAEFGIRCVVSTSFANIFENNCFKNSVLPVRVSPEEHATLLSDAESGKAILVDLETCTVSREDGSSISFDVDEYKRHCLLNGINEISTTLSKRETIEAFEKKMAKERPWL